MTRLALLLSSVLAGVFVVSACGDDTEAGDDPNPPSECGGCSLPPRCNADGTSTPAPCSCGCIEGARFSDGLVCTDKGCLVHADDAGADAAADGS